MKKKNTKTQFQMKIFKFGFWPSLSGFFFGSKKCKIMKKVSINHYQNEGLRRAERAGKFWRQTLIKPVDFWSKFRQNRILVPLGSLASPRRRPHPGLTSFRCKPPPYFEPAGYREGGGVTTNWSVQQLRKPTTPPERPTESPSEFYLNRVVNRQPLNRTMDSLYSTP